MPVLLAPEKTRSSELIDTKHRTNGNTIRITDVTSYGVHVCESAASHFTYKSCHRIADALKHAPPTLSFRRKAKWRFASDYTSSILRLLPQGPKHVFAPCISASCGVVEPFCVPKKDRQQPSSRRYGSAGVFVFPFCCSQLD